MEKEELYLIDENDESLQHYGTPQRYPGDPHGSGRYREGSGENPNQHSDGDDLLVRIEQLKRQGLTEKEIANTLDMSTTQLRVQESLAKQKKRSYQVSEVKKLKAEGLNNVQIAKIMGLKGESTVRSLLNSESEARMTLTQRTAENLAKIVDEKGMVDVGTGIERQLNISRTKLEQSLEILRVKGYEVYNGRMPQVTNKGNYTTMKVLCSPGTEYKEIYNWENIHSVNEYTSRDGGDTLEPSFRFPASMDSKRLLVRYAEDGGAERDGLIEIRRGVKDLSLGASNYAQVRILVDGNKYIKGMAVYNDDLPEGVDVLFNSNKSKAKYPNPLDTLKSTDDNLKKDPDNPFGSAIKEHGGQSYYDDPNGVFRDPVTGHRQSLSLINKRAEEGDWNDWSDTLPSQFLSKQPMRLINKQLNESMKDKQAEYDEIMSLTNPTVKRALLESFAEDCDSASVHLKAASLPGQKYQVIIPLTTLKDNEVYAPNYKDGTTLALIRYPHGGTFEIPIVTVNNRNEEGIKMLTTSPRDAIGINSNVAARLSGADFDGDTVTIIPCNDKVKIQSTHALKGLEGFDTKLEYGSDTDPVVDEFGIKHYYRGGKEYKIMHNTQTEMGIVSNLITDMTIKGATDEEKARAVRHSMVVIDAEKHKLDYKQSEIDNGIAELKKKYQEQIGPNGKTRHGASTLISKAKSEIEVPERKEGDFFTKDGKRHVHLVDTEKNLYEDDETGEIYTRNKITTIYTDPNTGKRLYHETGRVYTKAEYVDSNGKKQTASVITKEGKQYYKNETGEYIPVTNEKLITKIATQKSTKMEEVDDANDLVSSYRSPQELAYANYANKLKALANSSRKEALQIVDIKRNSTAAKAYANEASSLNDKLNTALLNAPKERQAQTIANSIVRIKMEASPDMSPDQEKKIRQQALSKARAQVGAHRNMIEITPREWEAIQAGAISATTLKSIINNSDTTILKQLAMPRSTTTISTAKMARINSMMNNGYTTYEIAEALGISVSTIEKYRKKKD